MGNSNRIPSTRVVATETPESNKKGKSSSIERSSVESPETQLEESCNVSELSSMTRTKKKSSRIVGDHTSLRARSFDKKSVCGIAISIMECPINCAHVHEIWVAQLGHSSLAHLYKA
jgi:hypothetical protein